MIREALAEDIPRLVVLGRAFLAETGLASLTEIDDDSFSRSLAEMVASENKTVLVAENGAGIIGMAGGLVYPLYFNFNHLTAQEMFWFVLPDHRDGVGAELFKAFEAWAREKGALSITMIALDSNRPKSVARVYKRAGYVPAERSFIRGL